MEREFCIICTIGDTPTGNALRVVSRHLSENTMILIAEESREVVVLSFEDYPFQRLRLSLCDSIKIPKISRLEGGFSTTHFSHPQADSRTKMRVLNERMRNYSRMRRNWYARSRG